MDDLTKKTKTKGWAPEKGTTDKTRSQEGTTMALTGHGGASVDENKTAESGWTEVIRKKHLSGTDNAKPNTNSQGTTGGSSGTPSGNPSSSNDLGTKRKLSGAQKKKRRLARQAAQEGPTKVVPLKRIRPQSNDEPIEAQNDPKRVKMDGSYKSALCGVKMAIMAENHKASALTGDMADPIMDLMFRALEATPDPLPTVTVGSMVAGIFHVTCENQRAADWLRESMDGKTIQTTKVRVVDAKDIPKPVKMAWRSKNTACKDISRVLGMLQRKNPGLQTGEWKVIGTEADARSVRRIVLMDRASADVIKAAGYSLHAGLDSSTFKVLEDSETLKRTTGPELTTTGGGNRGEDTSLKKRVVGGEEAGPSTSGVCTVGGMPEGDGTEPMDTHPHTEKADRGCSLSPGPGASFSQPARVTGERQGTVSERICADLKAFSLFEDRGARMGSLSSDSEGEGT
jgi:hypothetical protein